MTRLARDDNAVAFGLAREAGELVGVILDLPGADDRERLLVAAITVANLSAANFAVDEVMTAQAMAVRLTCAFVAGADAADDKEGEVPS